MSQFEQEPKPKQTQAGAKANAPRPVSDPVSARGSSGDPRAAMYRPAQGPVPAADAYDLLVVSNSILTGEGEKDVGRVKITGKTAPFVQALDRLQSAISGRDPKTDKVLTAVQKNDIFTEAKRALLPLVPMCKADGANDGTSDWVESEVLPRFASKAQKLGEAAAEERVTGSILVGQNQVLDIAGAGSPREKGELLRPAFKKLSGTLQEAHEKLVVAGAEDTMKEDANKFAKGESVEVRRNLKSASTESKTTSRITNTINVLHLIDGYLLLSDKELRDKAAEVGTALGAHAIATYSELVAGALEFGSGAIGLTFGAIGFIAAKSGATEFANTIKGFTTKATLGLGETITAIELVHGTFVLMDSHATRQEKLDAGVNVASGAAWLASKFGLVGETGAAAFGGALAAGYAEAKWALTTFWEAALGLNTGFFKQVFPVIQSEGGGIAHQLEYVQKAQALFYQERDANKREQLGMLAKNRTLYLSQAIDGFLDLCHKRSDGFTAAESINSYPILQELFAPLDEYRGTKTTDDAVQGAKDTLKKMTWAFKNAQFIVLESTRRGRTLADVENDEDEQERKATEKQNGDGHETHE